MPRGRNWEKVGSAVVSLGMYQTVSADVIIVVPTLVSQQKLSEVLERSTFGLFDARSRPSISSGVAQAQGHLLLTPIRVQEEGPG